MRVFALPQLGAEGRVPVLQRARLVELRARLRQLAPSPRVLRCPRPVPRCVMAGIGLLDCDDGRRSAAFERRLDGVAGQDPPLLLQLLHKKHF